MNTIALLDDHTILFEAFESIIKKSKKFLFVQGFETLHDLLNYLDSGKEINILFLDIKLEKCDGIKCIKIIKDLYPNLKIIIFTSYINKTLLLEALSNGASGYMIKNISRIELIKGINVVLDNQIYLHEAVNFYFNSDEKKTKHNLPKLTQREKEILKLIMDEYTSKEIAEKLFISINTVETHRANLFLKTGAKNVTGLIKTVLKENLLNI
jgi:DNA-binding NarL/FixJ family response regulator